MNWVAAVMLLAVLQSLVFGGLVAKARGQYKVPAPAISGNEVFERYFRVHYNTNELLLVFLPSLWLFGLYLSATWAAALGGIYLVGRVMYAIGYISAPEKREMGFGLSAGPTVILLLGALFGVIRAIVAS
jgi:glutathione S-transferase